MPAHFSAVNAMWKVCATKARPNTAIESQIASPTHIAARNGNTSRQPVEMTRATSAATDGPGEPAATNRAPAKMARDVRAMSALLIPRSSPCAMHCQRGLAPSEVASATLQNLDLVPVRIGNEEEAGNDLSGRREINQLARIEALGSHARMFRVHVFNRDGEMAIAVA